MKIYNAGENSVVVYFSEHASPEVSARVQHTAGRLPQLLGPALIDLVPSYASLLVIYDPARCGQLELRQTIRKAAAGSSEDRATEKLVELPTWYSTAAGPDLEPLARHAGLAIEEVIELHQALEYRVYAIGFAPGFAYLGELDPRIAKPRLATPRAKVPRGAVAIADRQTAVYPAASPGGWNLIGLCPVTLFDPEADPPMPLQVGDRVRFRAIEQDEYRQLGGEL
ncbi:MAG: 5-oxoprolinase subunit PxpB [Gammaproteobacteria bacterium]|uniref:5-oxoprolinase subunit PxpB n=1 Tax=Pseudomaricurvus alcaniphilus TaxID=1166482 RepID=UPI00140C9475|nr:5-oxoprolinase subunit PxpB [Pseudomaricurvus alcaniphilus]MBR9910807.1 5-oxoprolinase subunit PxpB [Gammaproteobacteria bacterium]NHN37315.1 5-oxoprolinase subunit PxpB [Pseudomaricurvus alcaniphilus]